MDEKNATAVPQMPMTTRKCWWQLGLRVIGRVLFGYAIILLIATALVAPLGGPREPPSNMSWNEFQKWTESGAWWKESVRTATIVAACGAALMFIGGKRKSSNQASDATSEAAPGAASSAYQGCRSTE